MIQPSVHCHHFGRQSAGRGLPQSMARYRTKANRRMNCIKSTSKRESGSSLLEIMIAVVILALVTLGLVEFFAKGRIWFDQEEHKRVASLLAQEAMEKTVTRGYPLIANWSQWRTVSNVRYSVAVTVQANTPEADMKTITSVATWQATPVAQRSVTLMTMVYEN